ncbi:hypothetical protein EK904_015025, partial [Melospiza melodia maxima]
MNNQEAGVLCCWRCRKYIENSVFLAKCSEKKTSQISQPSAAAQNSCNVWHVSLEAIPEWVKCVIEKAQWTIGKLHCPFCEACLGGFNFVYNKECSCGQLVNIHFFKTWTEDRPPFSVKLSKSSEKHLLLKIQSGFNKDTCHEVPTSISFNQKLSKRERNKSKSLRRKQRREQCLLKQGANGPRCCQSFRRRSNTVTRRHFPHAAHRMDFMDFEDDSRGWRFDMDLAVEITVKENESHGNRK